MNHDECQALLIDHHFGELDEARHRAVAAHLSTCATCALEFCRLRADLEGIESLGAEAPSASVKARLRERVAAEFPPSLFERLGNLLGVRVPIYQPALALALILVLVALLWPGGLLPAEEAQTVLEEYDAPGLVVVEDRIL